MKNSLLTCLLCLLIPAAFFTCKNAVPEKISPYITELPVPNQYGGEPNLHASADGKLFLSRVEFVNDSTDALVFSTLENGQWGAPQRIAQGSDWFVNWADFPSLAAFSDGKTLAAHWLQKSTPKTFDYDVRIALSPDGGKTWGASFKPHTDGISAEHGFVSLLPLPDNRMFAVWLDGRKTKTGKPVAAEDSHGHGHGGPMTLRCATFDANGNLSDNAELDPKICDCCQTAAVLTPKGVVVAYRDRSEEEVRDIFVTRQAKTLVDGKGGWTAPVPVFKDNWHITGCPVNGPALAASGETVALAWFTGAGEPQVKIAFSGNAAETFNPPIRVDGGKPAGRVDVVFLNEKTALVTWLEEVEGGAEIRALEIETDGKKGESFVVAATKASRQSGFPRVEKLGDAVFFAWTEVFGDSTRVRSGVVGK